MKPSVTYDEKGRKVYTLSIPDANRFALVLVLPLILFLGLPYYLLWGENAFLALRFRPLLFLLLFIVAGVVVHELLHGLVWALFARGGLRSIRFGVKWEYLTPYCHCVSSLKVWQFAAGGLAPLVLMGLVPSVWAMISGNTLLMFFGIFYSWTAAGDILAVWMLRSFSCRQTVYDHPSELGFILEAGSLEKNNHGAYRDQE